MVNAKVLGGPVGRQGLSSETRYDGSDYPPAQFKAPGLLGVPVSVVGSNVENFDAGHTRVQHRT
jgi:hypothetical protein